jgi:hypothetical protein
MVMRSGRYTVLRRVAALVPIAVLLAYLPAEGYLRCRMDGSVRAVCCCATGEAPASPGPVARAQDCCDRETTVSVRPTMEAPRSSAAELVCSPPPLEPSALAALALPVPGWDRARQSHGPPHWGPSVVVLKHAFLI